MEEYLTILNDEISELVEKKSKFIANLIRVNSKDEAEEKIKEIKKKYHDARHNCIAYRVIENGCLIEKSSDDGEPSGTAGAPMISILQKNNLCNVLVVVTRYFGGVLLGTGGLVRAYSDVTINAIKKSNMVKKISGFEFKVIVLYSEFDKFRYYCKINDINIFDIEYNEDVICFIQLKNNMKERLLSDFDTKKINLKKIEELNKKYI